MKVQQGLAPEYADFDEIDPDVEDAVTEFERGDISYSELKAVLGPEDAERIAHQTFGDVDGDSTESIEDLFDDPESF